MYAIRNLQAHLGKNQSIKELLYRGSVDGFTPEQFPSKCANKGKTLLVIKTQRDSIFGGYTDIPWVKDGRKKRGQGKSFLFLVQPDTSVLKFKHLKNGKSEILLGDLGPMFGGT